MRGAILHEHGSTPRPGDFDDPVAADGDVVVDVLAAGLNPVDLAMASGTFPGGGPSVPSIVGREGVGRLDGRRVYFDGPVAPYGSMAQRALIAADSAIDVPDDLDDDLAVCFGIAGLAAWLALEWRGRLQRGETVLVLGASGVVGLIGVQAARLLGAGRVVAAARREDGLRRAQELGADATVQLGAVDDLPQAFRDAGEGGVDLILDPLWGEPAEAAIAAANPEGRLVQIGRSAGETASIPSGPVRLGLLEIRGHTNFRTPQDVKRAAYERMARHGAAGELSVDVERIPLDDVADAWGRQKAGPGRKLVIVP